jgi:hypothetical protein
MPIGVGDFAQPGLQPQIHSRAHTFEHALKEMMVRVDQSRINHAAARVERDLSRPHRNVADLGNPAVFDANVAQGTFGGATATGEHPDRTAHNDRIDGARASGVSRASRDHASSAIELSCH